MVVNWKTTLFAVLGALPSILAALGVHIPPATSQGVLAVGTALTGIAAADADKVK